MKEKNRKVCKGGGKVETGGVLCQDNSKERNTPGDGYGQKDLWGGGGGGGRGKRGS